MRWREETSYVLRSDSTPAYTIAKYFESGVARYVVSRNEKFLGEPFYLHVKDAIAFCEDHYEKGRRTQ